ncbi:MAG: zinc ribbon domain-containing protein, partial [Bacillota bacterium]|nr:zinc ribbon domain-containing protein [Bacillota bacterium]
MYCPNCGKQNPDDAKFCESCGAPTGAVETPKAAPPPPPPPPPQYSAPPPPAYSAPVQQQYYQQPPSYSTTGGAGNSAPLSVGQFLGTLILFGIPLVGFILMLVWA